MVQKDVKREEPFIKIGLSKILIEGKPDLNIDLSVSLKKGQSLIITGPLGSGKSLTLKKVAGITPSIDRQNNITFKKFFCGFGSNHISYNERLRAFQYIPQDLSNFFITPNVFSEIELGCEIRGQDSRIKSRQRRRYLCQYGVNPLTFSPIGNLSTGESILVAICSALTRDPMILILDEPFINLSIENKKILSEGLIDYCSNGGVLIVATHEKDTIVSLLDKTNPHVHNINYSSIDGDSRDCAGDINEGLSVTSCHSSEALYEIKGADIQADLKNRFLFSYDDFIVNKCDIILLMGDNGTGKTTFLKYITGCYGKWPEEAIFCGESVESRTPAFPDDIGFVDHSPMVQAFDGKVREYLKFTSNHSERKKEAIENNLEIVLHFLRNLNISENDFITDLSFGQRKVMALARYLNSPRLLVIDEIPYSQNFEQQKTILSIFKMLSEKGSTIIFSSHLPEKYTNFINRTFMISKGWMSEI